MDFPIDQIQNMIYEIRGQRFILGSDLAKLYGVETKYLNKQVKRNMDRFPDDFIFQLTAMLSGVLNSPRAIDVNIAIMRTFTKPRSFLLMDNSLKGRVDELEQGTHKLFKIVLG